MKMPGFLCLEACVPQTGSCVVTFQASILPSTLGWVCRHLQAFSQSPKHRVYQMHQPSVVSLTAWPTWFLSVWTHYKSLSSDVFTFEPMPLHSIFSVYEKEPVLQLDEDLEFFYCKIMFFQSNFICFCVAKLQSVDNSLYGYPSQACST